MNEYVARVCWNSKGWQEPTGEAAQSEKRTYVAGVGFGHEEWLFDYQWAQRGYKYGFLQPINKGFARVSGSKIDVRLYTIDPDRAWFQVGRIRQCEVLTEQQAEEARSEARRTGQLREMTRQVKEIGGDTTGLKGRATLLFNIRFKPEHAERYDPMRVVEHGHPLRKLRRYTLTELGEPRRRIAEAWDKRVGTTEIGRAHTQRRSGTTGGIVDLAHQRLQDNLLHALQSKFGKPAVTKEEDYVDIKLETKHRRVFFEVKTHPEPSSAIREALGQLLLYGHVSATRGEPVDEFVVVGRGDLKPRDEAFLRDLRQSRRLPISYLCWRRGMTAKDLAGPWI